MNNNKKTFHSVYFVYSYFEIIFELQHKLEPIKNDSLKITYYSAENLLLTVSRGCILC